MELIKWANGKGYTLSADSKEEFDLLRRVLEENRHSTDVDVDETELLEDNQQEAI